MKVSNAAIIREMTPEELIERYVELRTKAIHGQLLSWQERQEWFQCAKEYQQQTGSIIPQLRTE